MMSLQSLSQSSSSSSFSLGISIIGHLSRKFSRLKKKGNLIIRESENIFAHLPKTAEISGEFSLPPKIIHHIISLRGHHISPSCNEYIPISPLGPEIRYEYADETWETRVFASVIYTSCVVCK